MPKQTDSFVATVLPRRVTFSDWLSIGGELVAEYFINNHYGGVVARGEDRGEPYACTRKGSKAAYGANIVDLARLL